MPRAATTLDPFNAVAEPKRRQVLETLAAGEMPVSDLVGRLGWPQPMVSKHLGVLKEVGLVTARRDGRQRLYRVNGEKLKTIHDWAKMFERFWAHQLLRIKERAERKHKEETN
jgi:DNA-binding transcriptional ArsR family regulator